MVSLTQLTRDCRFCGVSPSATRSNSVLFNRILSYFSFHFRSAATDGVVANTTFGGIRWTHFAWKGGTGAWDTKFHTIQCMRACQSIIEYNMNHSNTNKCMSFTFSFRLSIFLVFPSSFPFRKFCPCVLPCTFSILHSTLHGTRPVFYGQS